MSNMFQHLDSSIVYTVCFKNRNSSPVITYYTAKKESKKFPHMGSSTLHVPFFFSFSLPRQLFWVSDVCEHACLQLNNIFSVYLFLLKGWQRDQGQWRSTVHLNTEISCKLDGKLQVTGNELNNGAFYLKQAFLIPWSTWVTLT